MGGSNSFFAALSAGTSPTTNSTTTTSSPSLNDLPATLLESFIPGFSFVRRILLSTINFDVTLLVSGVLVLVGALSAWKYIYTALAGFAEKYLMSSITLEPDSELYAQVMLWISANVVTESSRSLTAKPSRATSDVMALMAQSSAASMKLDSEGRFDFSLLQAEMPVRYAPFYGDHFFWHDGRLYLLRREKKDVTMIGWGSAAAETVETVTIKTFGLSPAPIKAILQLSRKEDADRNRTLTTVKSPHRRGDMWIEVAQRPSRPLSTVYLDASDKDALLKDAMEFLHPQSHRFYASRGIPYRRGYLLYGPAGTGKTTMSMTLAGYFGLDLCVLSLVESTMTDERLGTLFTQLPSRCVILLEDIDAAGLERREELDKQTAALKGKDIKDKESAKDATLKDGSTTPASAPKPAARRGRKGRTPDGENQPSVTLSGLLNALDGVASQEGRILIMTTNDPEALDKALIRPGRVDMQVYFGYLSRASAAEMFVRMYQDDEAIAAPVGGVKAAKSKGSNGTTTTTNTIHTNGLQSEQQSKAQDLTALSTTFSNILPESVFTPAEVQGFLLSRRHSPQKAVAELPAWRDELLAAKQRGTNIIGAKAVEEMGVNGKVEE